MTDYVLHEVHKKTQCLALSYQVGAETNSQEQFSFIPDGFLGLKCTLLIDIAAKLAINHLCFEIN